MNLAAVFGNRCIQRILKEWICINDIRNFDYALCSLRNSEFKIVFSLSFVSINNLQMLKWVSDRLQSIDSVQIVDLTLKDEYSIDSRVIKFDGVVFDSVGTFLTATTNDVEFCHCLIRNDALTKLVPTPCNL